MKTFGRACHIVLAVALAAGQPAAAQGERVLEPRDLCGAASPTAIATFEDERLEAAVRSALSLAPGQRLTCGAASELTSLDAGNAGIESLAGIQNLTGLEELGLFGNAITDVGPLRDLERLTDLRLQSNPDLSDLLPLLENPGIGEGDRLGLGGTDLQCGFLPLLAVRRVTIDAIQTPEIWCTSDTRLSDEARVYRTYEHPEIRVSVVARDLRHPWGLDFLPNGDALVTERPGRLRLVKDAVLQPTAIAGTPDVMGGDIGVAGLLDVRLHPRFEENRLVYLTYSKETPAGATIALARGRFDGSALRGTEDIFVAAPWGRRVDYAGSRVVFAPDGTLYLTVGGAFGTVRGHAQDPAEHVGKVLRLNDDGSVPSDNPFVGRPGYAPEVYSMGHRNQQGAAVRPETGRLWTSEHAPQGGDEVNVILPGRNYGWPEVSYAREYTGQRVAEHPYRADLQRPAIVWLPSIAVTGMTFYTGDRFPAWKGNLFVGGLLEGRIRGSGHLERIALTPEGEELRRERLLDDLGQRVRAVGEGPDGLLYVLTDHRTDGALIRIEPVP